MVEKPGGYTSTITLLPSKVKVRDKPLRQNSVIHDSGHCENKGFNNFKKLISQNRISLKNSQDKFAKPVTQIIRYNSSDQRNHPDYSLPIIHIEQINDDLYGLRGGSGNGEMDQKVLHFPQSQQNQKYFGLSSSQNVARVGNLSSSVPNFKKFLKKSATIDNIGGYNGVYGEQNGEE